MDRDRRAAFLILKNIEENSSWSNLALGSFFAKNEVNSRAFVRNIVYGCLRNQMLLDHNIDRFLSKPKIKPAERILLRMGFYQLAMMNGVADYAAISETVNLAAAFIKGKQGFINAVLRNFQRSGKELTADNPSVKYSCHKSIAELWTGAYGSEKAEELMAESNRPAPLTIRTNTLKISREELISRLQKQGFEICPGEYSETCIRAAGGDLLDTELYAKGFFSVQGEASQLAVETLDPKPGEKLLDMCAAPGGKTCCAAELMGDKGSIIAQDVYGQRVNLISKETKRLGIASVSLKTADSAVFCPDYEEMFDCVIADVPCSGLGTIRRNPEIKLRPLDASGLPEIQRSIIENAFRYTKKGGRLLYSTCTVNPAECCDITHGFADNRGDCSIEKELQLFPTENGPDGFYICLLRRDDD